MQRIYESTQICFESESLVVSTALSLLPPKIQDKKKKQEKEKKAMLEISISEGRNDRKDKQTNTPRCRKEMTED